MERWTKGWMDGLRGIGEWMNGLDGWIERWKMVWTDKVI